MTEGGIKMNKQDLIAPTHYNLVTEFEKYSKDEEKLALIWESDKGEQKKSTYKQLIQRANKIANVFTNERSSKRRCSTCNGTSINRGI